ncbi:type III-B CRISPR module-associated protein Cmr5 [Anaerosinus sp.]|uniref:type III-B CRISPR module-associated protein Cmr5 n=1 Tax=Selenobaculum sp. TaxID=3074374 RepID=UPI003AB6FDCB
MNKQQIDEKIARAYKSIAACGLLNEEQKLNSSYRGQIAALGASIRQSSLLAALAFFSDQKNAAVDRAKLLDCIYYILETDEYEKERDTKKIKVNLFKKVQNKNFNEEDILHAVIALKLAMNLYPLQKKREDISNE